MRAQRRSGAAACIAAFAEALPFPDQSFDAVMAVLSDHHWRDPIAGLHEMRRVAARVVVFQFDNLQISSFWLVRDYLPEFGAVCAVGPSLTQRAEAIGAQIQLVSIPWDCVDGFFHAYWRRPEAYLVESVRRGTSVWARIAPRVEARAVAELEADLASGRWHSRNSELLHLEEADLGARLLIAG